MRNGRRSAPTPPPPPPPPRRYLVPADLTVGQFVYVIRKRIKVSPEKAIFMFVKNVLPPTGARACGATRLPRHSPAHTPAPPPAPPPAALMADVYADHKDEDGFLYIT